MASKTYGIPSDSPIVGIQVGTGADKVVVSSGGVITYEGAAKRSLTVRPNINMGEIAKNSFVPTSVELGAYQVYSMPVWNSDHEELYFRTRVPYRWDGTTNPTFKAMVALSAAEDVGDKFKFQLSWNNTSVTGAIEADVVSVETEVVVITDHSAQYSTYSISFELDIDDVGLQQTMVARNNLVGRLRRIASAAPAVTGEILVVDWVTNWTVDKLFGLF